MTDYRAPLLLLFGVLLLLSAWNANRSGEITLKWNTASRSTQPGLFMLALAIRVAVAAFTVALAGAAAFGLAP